MRDVREHRRGALGRGRAAWRTSARSTLRLRREVGRERRGVFRPPALEALRPSSRDGAAIAYVVGQPLGRDLVDAPVEGDEDAMEDRLVHAGVLEDELVAVVRPSNRRIVQPGSAACRLVAHLRERPDDLGDGARQSTSRACTEPAKILPFGERGPCQRAPSAAGVAWAKPE